MNKSEIKILATLPMHVLAEVQSYQARRNAFIIFGQGAHFTQIWAAWCIEELHVHNQGCTVAFFNVYHKKNWKGCIVIPRYGKYNKT